MATTLKQQTIFLQKTFKEQPIEIQNTRQKLEIREPGTLDSIENTNYVDEKEYGISTTIISTGNVFDCSSIVLHSPEQKKAALLHINVSTRPDNYQGGLKEVIEKLGGTGLDVYVGGSNTQTNVAENTIPL